MTQPSVLDLSTVAVRPEPGDNVAIVSRDLAPGTRLAYDGGEIVVPHRVLEGHRIVVEPIATGEALLSWSTPFARAVGDLTPGTYVCTPTSLDALHGRGVDGLPTTHSAVNEPLDPYRLDESTLNVGAQLALATQPQTFLGYERAGDAAGTRNHVVIIGVTSHSAAFVTELAARLNRLGTPGFDGVVPVAHTEAGERDRPNNLTFLLAVLAGFLVHPNVGAVLMVDDAGDAVTADDVRDFMREQAYPDIAVPHGFLTREGAFDDDLARAAAIVTPWFDQVAAARRTEQPLRRLKIALQCGGSDAFSGVTANPLAGSVAAEVIRHGGAAVLAETDELIGAEGYVLDTVASVEVARRFLASVDSFKQRVAWHGHSAEGNPSGGNVYRGLYNIVLKSVGAARKLDRRVRLDHVVDYGELLPGPGMTFMDTPGNDLESVAGEVAAGCNLVFFTTGNGSITNFPFVPTLKFVTTSARYALLSHEMDVDAGRYLTGTSMETLTAETFDQTLAAASGTPTAGERAAHSQVSIWRNWKQTSARPGIAVSIDGRMTRKVEDLPAHERDAETAGLPLDVPSPTVPADVAELRLPMVDLGGRRSAEQVALVLPTSLCSGQIALKIAEQASREDWHGDTSVRTVALPHTEGCGAVAGATEQTYARVMTGYLAHPSVQRALLLEHGCEKTHNDFFHTAMERAGLDPSRVGWASIQRDGGIEAVTDKVHGWFASAAETAGPAPRVPSGLGELSVALDSRGPLSADTARGLAELGQWVVGCGGSVLLPSTGELLADVGFRRHAFGSEAAVEPTLAHGQRPSAAGWHVMRMPTTDWTETGSGLGAGGADVLLTHVAAGTVSGQRLLPVLQISSDPATAARFGPDLDALVDGDGVAQAYGMLDLLVAFASGTHRARVLETGDVGFQITRGLLGTSV